jgi:hypothetical protein
MKIIDNRKANMGFAYLSVGDTFVIDNQVFMKIETCHDATYGECYNAVCLNDGTFYLAGDDDEWYPVTAELTIK